LIIKNGRKAPLSGSRIGTLGQENHQIPCKIPLCRELRPETCRPLTGRTSIFLETPASTVGGLSLKELGTRRYAVIQISRDRNRPASIQA
jgi:hypothetical protein